MRILPKISQKMQINPKNILTKFWVNIPNRIFGDSKKKHKKKGYVVELK